MKVYIYEQYIFENIGGVLNLKEIIGDVCHHFALDDRYDVFLAIVSWFSQLIELGLLRRQGGFWFEVLDDSLEALDIRF